MSKKQPCPTPHKRGYRDEIRAKLSLSNIRRYGEKRAKTPTRAYLCPCGLWHLTAMERSS